MMELRDMIATRNELRAQVKAIRIESRDLTGDAFTEAQQAHRSIMRRISQLHEAIQNHR